MVRKSKINSEYDEEPNAFNDNDIDSDINESENEIEMNDNEEIVEKKDDDNDDESSEKSDDSNEDESDESEKSESDDDIDDAKIINDDNKTINEKEHKYIGKLKHDNCIYDALEQQQKKIELPKETSHRITNNNDKITKKVLFKYERVRILGIRAKQIANGAPPMIKNFKGLSPKEIAFEELKMKVLPFNVIRKLPSGEEEIYSVNELEVVN